MHVHAQVAVHTSPLVLSHITEENGLSDNHVTAVFKDSKERVWAGTKDGLNLLDGSTIRIFKNDPADSNSIPNNYISGIIEDNRGTIWISTASGLCSYNDRSRIFTNINKKDKSNGETGGITPVVIDKNNRLWFGSARGLFSYDPQSSRFTLYYNNSTLYETDPRFSNKINHVIISADQNIWLATTDGLWKFVPATQTFTKIIHKQNDARYHPLCQYVYEDDSHRIWAGFWQTGLKRFDPASQVLTDFGHLLPDFPVSSICSWQQPDGKKLLWLNGKLLAFDESVPAFIHLQPPVTEKEAPQLSPVYRSADGWVWLASDEGLYCCNPQQQVFNHQLFNAPITTQAINMLNYKDGILVGAQAGDFLRWQDLQGNTVRDFSSFCRHEAAMLYMEKENENEYWFGTSDGIEQVNLSSGASRWFNHHDGDSSSLPRDFITALFTDSKNALWVFPWREGIWQMDKQTGKCKKMLDGFINESGKTKKLLISDAKEDADGNVWMADLDEGIILYNRQTGNFSKPFEKELGSRVHTARIFNINGKMFSATPWALFSWEPSTKKIVFYFLPPELNKGITDFCPDQSGNWWMVTSNGLVYFNEQLNSFRRFTVADGLYQNDPGGNLYCSGNNTMILAAPGYFSYFKPALLDISAQSQKKIYLTAFMAGNKMIDTDSNQVISLSNTENNITIRWALPSFSNPLKNQYYYQLEGLDSAWRYAGNKGEVQYANLSPGNYTILLKAATSNETASANIIRLHFIIHPPYWKTWWFIALVVIAISSLFYAVVRYISQRNLKEKLLKLEKEQAIEKERNRISRDMHDDLGSGLTKIAILSEVVKKQMNEPEKAKAQLENISQSSRELVDNLQDIIWILNPKNDTLENLAAYIREYGLKFFEPFHIQIHFQYPEKFPDLKLSEETRRNIFLVIKETFNNTAKHSQCSNVNVIIEHHLSLVTISIRDDGKGFDETATRPFGNGLQNMKNRIEQIGGAFRIESSGGEGTQSIIEIHV